MAALRMARIAFLVMTGILSAQAWMTNYDERFTFSCHNNQFLSFIESIHDNHSEDRVFNFKCRDMPSDAVLTECKWSGFVNSYDGPVTYHCPGEGVMIGIDSIHHNSEEDRIFSFMCCKPGSYITHKCVMTDYLNQYDGHLEFTVPPGRYLKGVYSVHNNHPEDRIFRFDTCEMDLLNAEPGLG